MVTLNEGSVVQQELFTELGVSQHWKDSCQEVHIMSEDCFLGCSCVSTAKCHLACIMKMSEGWCPLENVSCGTLCLRDGTPWCPFLPWRCVVWVSFKGQGFMGKKR